MFSSLRVVYSPRVWRWSYLGCTVIANASVFSTCVEVIPICWVITRWAIGILHVCGGDPHYAFVLLPSSRYSPRVWRWSLLHRRIRSTTLVFSTCVEVILLGRTIVAYEISILHVCGGDPNLFTILIPSFLVFSTCVEVILNWAVAELESVGILHVCGGDPSIINVIWP